MKSVLKPRFKKMMDEIKDSNTNREDESNSSIESSIKSVADIGDGWEGDSESVYEIAEEYLSTDQDLDVDDIN